MSRRGKEGRKADKGPRGRTVLSRSLRKNGSCFRRMLQWTKKGKSSVGKESVGVRGIVSKSEKKNSLIGEGGGPYRGRREERFEAGILLSEKR